MFPNFLHQQARFDAFLTRYNHERPHQALGMKVPGELYTHSPRPYQGLGELDYPGHDWTVTVTRWNGCRVPRSLLGLRFDLLLFDLFLEAADGLAHAPTESGEPLGPEDEDHDEEDDHQLREADRAEKRQHSNVHNGTTFLSLMSFKRISRQLYIHGLIDLHPGGDRPSPSGLSSQQGIVRLKLRVQSRRMISQTPSYRGYRFPPEIISHAVWLYHRFCLSFRDTEDLLAQRGITVSYETIRQWCRTFGPAYARTLRRRRGRMGDTWYLDELFVNIQGRQQYLWRAVDEDGDEIDILVQSRRNRRAAVRFFRKVLKGQGREPRRLVTDKLRSYPAACRTVMPSVVHVTDQYANNRAEVSHQPTRQRERQMRRFKSAVHAQRFLSVHGVVLNLFRLGRHLLRAAHHRLLRTRAFGDWRQVTCA